jgi:hypothetical protein
MNLFVKHLAPFIRDFPQVTLSRRIELDVQNYCIDFLKLKNIGELRDRFEGQKFLDNALNKVSSYQVCISTFSLNEISIDNILKMKKSIVEIKGMNYEILVFHFGELPQIPSNENPIVFILKKDQQTYSVCGTASLDVINDEKNYSVEKGKKYFSGFKKLSPVN